MLYTYMKPAASNRKSKSQDTVAYAWIGEQRENLFIVTRNEDKYCMPEVTPFDIACWAMARGAEVFVEDGVICLTNDQIREYAAEHRRYWEAGS